MRLLCRVALVLLLGLAGGPELAAQNVQRAYPNAPEVLRTETANVVGSVAVAIANQDSPLGPIATGWNQLVFLTVADAMEAHAQLQKLSVYRNLGETARADKQAGAGASSSGSTTLVEKSGVPLLLAYAIEHGAITQAVSGTSITLSTTPYGLVAGFGGKDTAENYEKYGHWGRLGFSASFNTGQNQPAVETVRPKQLENWSARYVLFGDRSTRSQRFADVWQRTIGAQVQRRVNVLAASLSTLFSRPDLQASPLWHRSVEVRAALLEAVRPEVQGRTTPLTDAEKQELTNRILGALHEGIFQPIRAGTLEIPQAVRDELGQRLLPALLSAEQDLAEATNRLSEVFADFKQRPQMTLAYTHHRTAEGSDLSELKLLLDGHLAPMDFVLNAGATLFHSPDRALGQQTLRSFHLSGSLEWQGPSPFRVSENDLSRTLVSLSGRFQRSLRDGAAAAGNGNGAANGTADDFNIGIFQGKVEIPLGAGLALPFSFTYATRTERIDEKEVRGNFGLTFDLDKLYGLLLRMGER